MIERVRNVLKSDKKKGVKRPSEITEPVEQKRKKVDTILRRYPISSTSTAHSENSESLDEHKKAIAAELAKTNSRDTVLLPLLELTYDERRMFILSGGNTVKEVLAEYPALSKPAIVRP